MPTPTIAADSPIEVELKKGKKYWFCTCGKSQKQPFCDSAHKGTEFEPHVFEAQEDGKFWLCRCKHTADRPFCDGTHNNLAK
jgi:CDGSH-type Zn-finger protein